VEADLGREAVYSSATFREPSLYHRSYVRYVHQQLLVRIAAEFRFSVKPLCPCLLHYPRPRSRLRLVQRVDGGEVDLLVDVVVQRRRDVVGVVMSGALRMVVTVMAMLVVAVRHIDDGAAGEDGDDGSDVYKPWNE